MVGVRGVLVILCVAVDRYGWCPWCVCDNFCSLILLASVFGVLVIMCVVAHCYALQSTCSSLAMVTTMFLGFDKHL